MNSETLFPTAPLPLPLGEEDPGPGFLPSGRPGGSALALAVSAALHAALLSLVVLGAAMPGNDRPLETASIRAFLVDGERAAPAAPRARLRPEPASVAPPRVETRAAVPPAAANAESPTPTLPVAPVAIVPPPPRAETRDAVSPAAAKAVSPAPTLPATPVAIVPPLPRSETRAAWTPAAADTERIDRSVPGAPAQAGGGTAGLASHATASALPQPPVADSAGGADGNRAGTASAGPRTGGQPPAGSGTGPESSRTEAVAGNAPSANLPGPPGEAVAHPRYGENSRPVYPPLARLRGYQGVVILLVEVRADGRVGRAAVRRSAGYEILDRAALDSVRGWRFEPGRRAGQAVPMSVEVPIRFLLSDGSAG